MFATKNATSMLTRNDIEKFYADLENLQLRFPVAELARATGFSKGNVSDYINKKKVPSEVFIKKFYSEFHISSKEVHTNGTEEPQRSHSTELTNQTIFNLSESAKQNAAAALLREQNTKRMIEAILTENAPAENQITFDAIAGGLRELLIDLGMGKHWKSREEGAAAVRNKLYGQLKKKKAGDTQNG